MKINACLLIVIVIVITLMVFYSSFLKANDPYRAYYDSKVDEVRREKERESNEQEKKKGEEGDNDNNAEIEKDEDDGEEPTTASRAAADTLNDNNNRSENGHYNDNNVVITKDANGVSSTAITTIDPKKGKVPTAPPPIAPVVIPPRLLPPEQHIHSVSRLFHNSNNYSNNVISNETIELMKLMAIFTARNGKAFLESIKVI